MRDNLIKRYKALTPSIVDMPDKEIRDFLVSIEGKEVELVFIGEDAFEKNDDSIWLPDCLWDEILPAHKADRETIKGEITHENLRRI